MKEQGRVDASMKEQAEEALIRNSRQESEKKLRF